MADRPMNTAVCNGRMLFLFNFYLPFSCNGGFVKIAHFSQTDADLMGRCKVLATCNFFIRESESLLFSCQEMRVQ